MAEGINVENYLKKFGDEWDPENTVIERNCGLKGKVFTKIEKTRACFYADVKDPR